MKWCLSRARAMALPAIVFGLAVVLSNAAFALEGDPVTLETGVANVTGHVDAAVTYLGTVVTAVIGAYFTFKVIKMALRWVGRAGG